MIRVVARQWRQRVTETVPVVSVAAEVVTRRFHQWFVPSFYWCDDAGFGRTSTWGKRERSHSTIAENPTTALLV
jgi:hypothetical protein